MTIHFLDLQITRSDIRPHIKRAVSLVSAYDHFYLPRGFVWVYMGLYTHFITPENKQVDLSTKKPALLMNWTVLT